VRERGEVRQKRTQDDDGWHRRHGRSFRIDQAVITHLRDGKVAEAWEIADIAALQVPQLTEACWNGP